MGKNDLVPKQHIDGGRIGQKPHVLHRVLVFLIAKGFEGRRVTGLNVGINRSVDGLKGRGELVFMRLNLVDKLAESQQAFTAHLSDDLLDVIQTAAQDQADIS